MPGIDRNTGKMASEWDHTVQSIRDYILPTPFGVRVMREDFGSFIPLMLLRENLDNENALLMFWAIALAIDLWEPRFDVKRVKPAETVTARRKGRLPVAVVGDFMPRGHLGDFTVEKHNVSVFLA
ncbi:GPW/gp25 family protein [uncultured Cohaesibacter sp.]|uniref:GPW/gp25 family protein n=1 Tax=uncultured Cohaesibacter sp. TaxID=1002546 RepID=UPI002A0A4AEA|nr:GPW/gp25 family protein [uncultured Cohaesibacter sp.]